MVNWKEVAGAIEQDPEHCAKELVEHLHRGLGNFIYLAEEAHAQQQSTITTS